MTHLRQIMLEELERRNYAPGTIRSYIRTVEHFAQHFRCSPDKLGLDHIRQYQAAMFRTWKLAPNTVAQRLAALRFLYIQVLKRGWSAAETPYPKKVLHLPEILSQQEVARLIDATETPFQRILVMTLYATGARRAEVARLKVADIDSQRMVVHIRGGKGRKDRDVMLSPLCLKSCEATGAGSGTSRVSGCFPATGGIRRAVRSPPRCCGQRASRPRSAPVWSTSTSIRIPCVTALRPTCSKPEPIYARSRSCSVIAISKRPPSISTSPADT